MLRPLIFILFVLLTGLFAMLNWPAFTTPTTLSLAFTTVQAPLGMIMLVLLAVACIAFATWAITLQGRALLESRRMTKELQVQRDLADKAEASRFTELRSHVDTGLERLQRSIEQQSNALAAQLAQLEDRLQENDRRQLLGGLAGAPASR